VVLAAEDHFAVLGVAHDHGRTVDLAGHHRPPVLLLDATCPARAR
jgi:hypothetical protein